jgi:DNA mismatch repair protein MutH
MTFDDFKEYGSIEKIAIGKLSKYIGKDVDEIYSLVGQGLNRNAKSFYANLAARMLGVRKNKIEEFEKGDITVKTIRLKYSGMPKEDMSFPYFDYNEIIKEEWESSSFLELLEKRYFFMIYQYDNNGLLHFINGMFWNMPYEDIEEAKKVWEETVKRIKEGRAEDLPRKSENDYCHVRPHARDSNDTCDTPYGNPVVKKCFWLNAKYLKGQIEKNLE